MIDGTKSAQKRLKGSKKTSSGDKINVSKAFFRGELSCPPLFSRLITFQILMLSCLNI